jgi:epoxide hydrolase-like predicted phosphatase
MIKHLIFDFGGVFLDLGGENGKIHYNLEKVFGISEEKALELWKEHKEKLIVGTETPEEFLKRVGAILNHPISTIEAHELWKKFNKMEKGSIDWALVDYVESLKKNYKIHMLSNAIDLDAGNAEWADLIHKNFDNIYKSFSIGHKKPNKEAFLHVLEKIGAKPEECVFVDDLQINIDAANELGINSVLYTNLDQLKKDFSRFEIK